MDPLGFLVALTAAVLLAGATWVAVAPVDLREDRSAAAVWWMSPLLALGQPFGRVFGRWSDERLRRLSNALDRAGVRDSLDARTYLGARSALVALAALVSLAATAALPAHVNLVAVCLAVAVAGAGAWNGLALCLWLATRARTVRLERELPVLLNVLALSERAGCDLATALERAYLYLGSADIRRELGQVLRQIRLGKPVEEALRELAQQTGIRGTTGLASAALQARKVGGKVGPWLQTLADQCWSSWVHKRREKALRAPIWLVLPMVLLLLPAFGIIILGPAAVTSATELKNCGIF
ncbi:MAG: hypothetical protein AUJ96_32830 [Armatimonadetes bacterium CG2_30_66_41]|nr:hypothetical protein [Armatimonadota bacterium]OIO92172.1 MAG: hypothetical protein AUJ96_32830 [Armatimonadetes bacterium CG2_30_66_41]NCO93804.1 hypothetical protein [Armatimonadota bacterium]NCP31620.1 hypothetical protein [Armatimonadota bacterium]NCQ31649.1 hypothetical protein [Armatimonadota bacterium]